MFAHPLHSRALLPASHTSLALSHTHAHTHTHCTDPFYLTAGTGLLGAVLALVTLRMNRRLKAETPDAILLDDLDTTILDGDITSGGAGHHHGALDVDLAQDIGEFIVDLLERRGHGLSSVAARARAKQMLLKRVLGDDDLKGPSALADFEAESKSFLGDDGDEGGGGSSGALTTIAADGDMEV